MSEHRADADGIGDVARQGREVLDGLLQFAGQLAGTFSIDLKQPYRLLFVPIEDNAPTDRSDEQKRWASITKIEIVTIENTHG